MKFFIIVIEDLATARSLNRRARRFASMMCERINSWYDGVNYMTRLEPNNCWWLREISLFAECIRHSTWNIESRFLPEVTYWGEEVNFKLCRTTVLFCVDVTDSTAFPSLVNCVIWLFLYPRNQIFAAPKIMRNAECLTCFGGPNLCRVLCNCIRARWTNFISPRLARGISSYRQAIWLSLIPGLLMIMNYY